jgi:hypothetical protein
MDNFCFVIQPFNKESFNKRFDDTYAPAIQEAQLSAYRVDRDVNVRVPIEDIESKIKESVLCFADITEDNPNVWYELGYAYACGKDVVMICSEERKDFPFDIRHKQIIRYKTESKSDFDDLKKKITEKINAFIQTGKREQLIIDNPIKGQEGLKDYELTLLFLMMSSQISDEDSVPLNNLQEKMNKAGYNNFASNTAVRKLVTKGFLVTDKESSWNNDYEIPICKLTPLGVKYIIDNEQLFDMKAVVVKKEIQVINDDLPF